MANLYKEGARFGSTLGGDLERSVFDLRWHHSFSASVGALYPIMLEENIPGDMFHLESAISAIMLPSIYPTMDQIVMDVAYFSVPLRLIWDNFKKFMGDTEPSNYEESTDMVMPYFLLGDTSSERFNNKSLIGDIMDSFGVQPGVPISYMNALPYRGYRLIWNEWYRNTALQDSLLINKGDTELEYIPYLLRVNRFKDYFTTALPNPQITSDPVVIPLNGLARVETAAEFSGDYDLTSSAALQWAQETSQPGETGFIQAGSGMLGYINGIGTVTQDSVGGGPTVLPSNLGVDFARQINAVGSTVTALREAVSLQRYLEALNRGGRRYREQLMSVYGVESPDATQQIPEFLGGARFHINMSTNVQTGANSGDQALGSLSGVSITKERSFEAIPHVYTEHCLTIGVCSFRVLNHTYQQGAPRFFFKKQRTDLYIPEFANISEQPIYAGEIFLSNQFITQSGNAEPFGYNEAWSEYRYHPSKISGQLRKGFQNENLAPWTYADDYLQRPFLSAEWLFEPRSNVDNTLVYPGGTPLSPAQTGLDPCYWYPYTSLNPDNIADMVTDQFVVDIAFNLRAERPLPMYSIPGGGDL